MSNSSIWTINKTLSGATTPDQGGSGNDGNKGVLRIPQSYSIIEASPSDWIVSYLGHLLGEVVPLGRYVVGVFYSPIRLAHNQIDATSCKEFKLDLFLSPKSNKVPTSFWFSYKWKVYFLSKFSHFKNPITSCLFFQTGGWIQEYELKNAYTPIICHGVKTRDKSLNFEILRRTHYGVNWLE